MRHRFPHELSGGEQQRVAVARALARQSDLVLFDEPFSNLDAYLRPRMRRELKKILRQLKITALFVTHDQTEAIELADRMAVLRAGRLEQFDTPEKIYSAPATRFVAEFVGDADFISGQLDKHRLKTELGDFTLHTLFPNEQLAPLSFVGAALVLLAVIATLWHERRNATLNPKTEP